MYLAHSKMINFEIFCITYGIMTYTKIIMRLIKRKWKPIKTKKQLTKIITTINKYLLRHGESVKKINESIFITTLNQCLNN